MTHTWDGNLAQLPGDNASASGGILSLSPTSEPSDTGKPYRGVEMRSLDTLTYGKVEVRTRFAKGAGVVSAIVMIYTPWPPDDWNEIDIEFLGKSTNEVQLNHLVLLVFLNRLTTVCDKDKIELLKDLRWEIITITFELKER